MAKQSSSTTLSSNKRKRKVFTQKVNLLLVNPLKIMLKNIRDKVNSIKKGHLNLNVLFYYFIISPSFDIIKLLPSLL